MNNKGWLRIVEASLAILIVFGVLLALYSGGTSSGNYALDERASFILTELSQEMSFRNATLEGNNEFVTRAVAKKIPESHLAFEARICEISDVCGKSSFTNENVYAAERVISSSLDIGPGAPISKKVRLFVWQRTAPS